jgi:hypothetical protein
MRGGRTSSGDRTAAVVLMCLALARGSSGFAAEAGVLVSRRASADFPLTADPKSAAWKGVRGVYADRDRTGQPVPGHRTEIRSRWTDTNLYVLFIAPYETLSLNPAPSTSEDTNRLWQWDVAEVFIGTDPQDIRRYKELQVSPQGEWVDLAIDRTTTPATHDLSWNSGYTVKARVHTEQKVWYGEMRIPLAALGLEARPGVERRLNLYRIQGPPDARRHINWQVVNAKSFHTPEAFGRLRLAK